MVKDKGSKFHIRYKCNANYVELIHLEFLLPFDDKVRMFLVNLDLLTISEFFNCFSMYYINTEEQEQIVFSDALQEEHFIYLNLYVPWCVSCDLNE